MNGHGLENINIKWVHYDDQLISKVILHVLETNEMCLKPNSNLVAFWIYGTKGSNPAEELFYQLLFPYLCCCTIDYHLYIISALCTWAVRTEHTKYEDCSCLKY